MAFKQFFLGLNWKMNPSSPVQVGKLIKGYQEAITVTFPGEIVAFVPDIYLDQVRMEKERNKVFIEIGAQDISTEPEAGAFTGQTSAHMLMAKKIPYVLIGHSEKRQYHHELDTDITQKIKNSYAKNLQPLVCFGDNGHDGNYEEVNYPLLDTQLEAIFTESQSTIKKNRIIIAYEPIWAIGTGVNAEPEHIQTVFVYIKKKIHQIGGEELVAATRILYGGSVNDTNIQAYAKISQVDGFLVGGASLKPEILHKMLLEVSQ
jgi:triosephosphate isomerase